MDTIHPPNTGRSGFYQQDELRPFSNRLAAYTAYALVLIDLRLKVRSVDAMNRALQKRRRLRRARLLVQAELQSIYQHVALGLRLPRIPVHLPLRKRISAAGLVSHRFLAPLQIRVFTLCGNPKKPRRLWMPSDVGIRRPTFVCEVLLHEIAHVHQGFYTGQWDHERGFADSYHAVEEVFLGFGFGPLLPREFRFAGCPPGSFADSLRGSPRQSKSLDFGVYGENAANP